MRNSRSILAAVLIGLTMGTSVARPEAVSQNPAAPPHKCEMRQPVWCIYQGASEVADRFAKDPVFSHVWTIRGFFKPQAPLVVLEPDGCRVGRSDAVSALGFDEHVPWEGKSWDRIRVRLKSDGSCDMQILVPLFATDPSGEAYFTGLALIQNCTDENCSGQGLAGLRGQFESQYRRRK